jgi:hypothetical protein
MKVITQPFIGTTAEWQAANPMLYDGVLGIEELADGRRLLKLGRPDPDNPGLTLRWNELPYVDESYIHGLPEHLQALEQADAQLQQNIDTEAQARLQADSQLQQNIDAEARARQAADELLQQEIDAEAQARQQADSQLQQNIDTEAQTRAQADELLQRNIDTEAQTRAQADELLQEEIDGIEPYSEKGLDELRYAFGILQGFITANLGPIHTLLGADDGRALTADDGRIILVL